MSFKRKVVPALNQSLRYKDAWGSGGMAFFTSALDGGNKSVSSPGRFSHGDRAPPRTHWTGGWMVRSGRCGEEGRLLSLPEITPIPRSSNPWPHCTERAIPASVSLRLFFSSVLIF
jgi:hypothetical protein